MRPPEILEWFGLMSDYPNKLISGTLLPARPPIATPNAVMWNIGAPGYHSSILTVTANFKEWLHLNWSSHPWFTRWLALNPDTWEGGVILAIHNYTNLLPVILSLLHPQWGGILSGTQLVPITLSGWSILIGGRFTQPTSSVVGGYCLL